MKIDFTNEMSEVMKPETYKVDYSSELKESNYTCQFVGDIFCKDDKLFQGDHSTDTIWAGCWGEEVHNGETGFGGKDNKTYFAHITFLGKVFRIGLTNTKKELEKLISSIAVGEYERV